MKLKEWSEKQGISYLTAWRWCRDGKMPVPFIKTKTGMILVNETHKEENQKELIAIYCRVSSNDKKEDLKRQIERCEEFCRAKGWVVDLVVSEIASGMNDNRKKLKKLLDLNPTKLIIEYKDRLTRFGFNYFEYFLLKNKCELVVINRDKEIQEDLTKDLIAIVTSFCCKIYGLRSGKNKLDKIKKLVHEAN